jgi:hypothetical protein
MRNGYILLHRKGITEDEWKHPLRSLAWIDLLTLVAWDDYTDTAGKLIRRGEVIASETFLAKRWRQNRGTVHRWLEHWEKSGQVQRLVQHQSQQVPQRLFVVNYAKYQGVPQRPSQQVPQQVPQTMKVKEKKEKKETNDGGFENELVTFLGKQQIENPRAYLQKLMREVNNDTRAIRKAWSDWKRGVGIESPSQFFSRCIHYHKTLR